MKRRPLLTALGTSVAAVAGCVSGTNTDNPGTNDTRQTGEITPPVSGDSEASRPHCELDPETVEVESSDETRELETVGTIPYPDPPEEFTAEVVLDFVEDHEEAYIRHDALCDSDDRIVSFSYSVDRSWLAEDDPVFAVILRYAGGATAGVADDGTEWVADIGYSGVAYAVDDQGAARAGYDELLQLGSETDIEQRMPDPAEDGTVVVEF